LNIVFVASEGFPYVKTGGLADVVGALPKALRALGHQPIVILPKYSAVDYQSYPLIPFLSPLACGWEIQKSGVRFIDPIITLSHLFHRIE